MDICNSKAGPRSTRSEFMNLLVSCLSTLWKTGDESILRPLEAFLNLLHSEKCFLSWIFSSTLNHDSLSAAKKASANDAARAFRVFINDLKRCKSKSFQIDDGKRFGRTRSRRSWATQEAWNQWICVYLYNWWKHLTCWSDTKQEMLFYSMNIMISFVTRVSLCFHNSIKAGFMGNSPHLSWNVWDLQLMVIFTDHPGLPMIVSMHLVCFWTQIPKKILLKNPFDLKILLFGKSRSPTLIISSSAAGVSNKQNSECTL